MGQTMNLKKWRESKGFTQAQVADQLTVHKQYISDIERGVRKPGAQLALAIRDLSDGVVSLDAQFDDVETEKAA